MMLLLPSANFLGNVLAWINPWYMPALMSQSKLEEMLLALLEFDLPIISVNIWAFH